MIQNQNQLPKQNEFRVLVKAKELADKVYMICRKLPKEERFIIIPQICRAAISVCSNIAEGQERKCRDNLNFIRMARGSLYEVKTQLEIIEKLYLDRVEDSCESLYLLIDEIDKMTYGLIRRLRSEADYGPD